MAEKMLKIDGLKLKKALKTKKLTMKDVSNELGYESSYVSICCKTDKISRSAAKLLEVLYDIKLSDYEYAAYLPDNEAIARLTTVENTITHIEEQQQAILSKLVNMQGKLSDMSVKLATLQNSTNVTRISTGSHNKHYAQK